jgi:hypothetical protein
MNIVPIVNPTGGLIGVEIHHDGEMVVFNMATRRTNVDAASMYDTCNSVIRNLSPEVEEQLFGAYLRASQLYTSKSNIVDTLDELRDIHGIINDCVSPFGVEAWATGSYMGFAIPQAISNKKEGSYPAHSSYDNEAYSALCGLSTFLKFHVPIVFLFLDPIGAALGKDVREYVLFNLIRESDLLETAAYTKLKKYTQHLASVNGEVRIPTGLLLEGICDEDEFAKLILAPKLLRDLALSETDVPYIGDAVNNITAKITKAITTQLATLRKQHEYTTKKAPNERLDSQDGNLSGHEDTSVHQPYSSLYRMVYNRASESPTLHVTYGVPDDINSTFKDIVIRHSDDITLNTIKLTILALTLRHLPPESLTLIRPTGVYNLIAVAGGVLHQRGLHELVSLLLSGIRSLETLTPAGHYIAAETKPDSELLAKAQANYYEQEGGHDLVTRELDNLLKKILSVGWVQHTPTKLHPTYGTGKTFTPSREFKNQLLTLLI